jgi:hypothetical protein
MTASRRFSRGRGLRESGPRIGHTPMSSIKAGCCDQWRFKSFDDRNFSMFFFIVELWGSGLRNGVISIRLSVVYGIIWYIMSLRMQLSH